MGSVARQERLPRGKALMEPANSPCLLQNKSLPRNPNLKNLGNRAWMKETRLPYQVNCFDAYLSSSMVMSGVREDDG